MTSCRTKQATDHTPRSGRSPWAAAVALALALVLVPAQAAPARDTTLSKEDQVCLDCHAKPGLRKTLGDGQALSLYIAPQDFAQSKHNSSGCEGCHSDIDTKSHGKQAKPMASRRAHAQEMMQTCRDCHKKAMKQYEDSVHSALVQAGSDKAPLCSSCHDPHATRSAKQVPAGETGSVLCQQCHKALAQAFEASVHGQSGGENLDCKDCHRTHNSKSATTGDHLKGQCVSCHKEVATSHAQWLPNTQHHLEAVACAACHVPGTTRRVDLRIYEAAPGQAAAEKVGVPQFVKLANSADPKGTGIDGRALWSLLQEVSRNPDSKTFVRGRLEVQTGIEAHSLAPKGKALKDCATCHQQGAAAFQAVTVSLAGADGLVRRHGASSGILNSLESVGSVGGFYAIGSTRIKLLDTLLVLTLAMGIAIPALHLSVKLFMARRRKAAAAAAAAAQAAPVDETK